MEKIIKLLKNFEVEDEKGKIKDINFAKKLLKKKAFFKQLPINNSYLPKTEWYGINIENENDESDDENDDSDYNIVLIRISDLIPPLTYYEELIQKEYILNKELLEYGIVSKFKGYSIFNKNKVVSIFYSHSHNTLKEYAKNKKLIDVVKELIQKLYLLHPENSTCYLLPTLSSDNILWSKNDMYTIIFTEIFLSINSIDSVIRLKEFPSSKWLIPELKQLDESNQYTLSYYSSIHSFGYVLFYLLTRKEPFKSDDEWKKFFEENSDDKEYTFFRDIVKKCINASEKKPVMFSSLYMELENANISIFKKSTSFIQQNVVNSNECYEIEVYDIYRPNGSGYKLIKYEYDNDDDTKYFSVVPHYIFNGIKTIEFGVRSCLNINKKITLAEPKSFNNNNEYSIKLTNTKPDRNINIYKPIYKNELNYLRQVSLINPKNYEYSYQYIYELVNSVSNNNLVDIILKTGFNSFTKILIKIIKSRNYSLSDISEYIDSNYSINTQEYKNAPKLIKLLTEKKRTKDIEQKPENNNVEQITVGKRDELLCDMEYLNPLENKTDPEGDIISDAIKEMEKKKRNLIDYIDEKSCMEKIEEYNNSLEGQKRKLTLIPTPETIKKINQIYLGLLTNTAIIIQGFTSAGKSFISTISSVICRGQYPISTALSENTTVEDLLGRLIIQRNESSMMSFVQGILLKAFTQGLILILDECDLANPEVLSCILNSISKDEITVNNNTYKKRKGYNVILTMNGEAEGFTKTQRNELTSNILSKFVIVKFDKMSKEECEIIFKELVPKKDNYNSNVPNFVKLHQKLLDYSQKTVDPIVTLRNLKACTYLSKVNIPVRDAAEIAYSRRFPKDERDIFEDILKEFGNDFIDNDIKDEIINKLNENNLYYDESYLKCAYLALSACKAGLHPLLIGKNGSGLTELARFVARNYNINHDSFLKESQRDHIEEIQFCSETSLDDLLGCFQPSTSGGEEGNKNNEENIDLTKFISWVDGPVLKAGKSGNPVILDEINCAKSQVIEYLNPLLDGNSVFNNVQFNLIEKDNKEVINIGKGFVIIGTMKMEEEKKLTISKALMNRFVAIYLDNFSLNNEAIEKITDLTIQKLNTSIYNTNENGKFSDNENEEDDEESQGIYFIDSSDESESDGSDDKTYSNISYNEIQESRTPNWYNIDNFNNVDVNDMKEFIKNNKFDNIKSLIKTITQLCYIIQRTNMSISDSYTLLKLSENIFSLKDISDLISKMLHKDKSESNRFLYDNEKPSNALKMIISLMTCDLSGSHIFIQGSPGSGKSVAARHYGAFRKFRNRNPILSISCNSEISFEQFVGTFSFKNTSLQFNEGPLLTAMKYGEPILIDEFNLCSEEVLINLLPLLKAKINDYVQLKGVPYKVQIKPGFLVIATGNNDNESGRKKIPQSILDELTVVKISNSSLEEYKSLLSEIIKNEYNNCVDYINPDMICDIVKTIETLAQQNFTLRQIKILLNRINRFCVGELTDPNISYEEYRKIPVAYVIIGFIIPSLRMSYERIKNIVEKIGEITNIDSNELLEFIKSDVTIVYRNRNKQYIKKGKIILSTSLKKDYPPIILQTYFWIRMTCSLYSDTPSKETLLLVGETSYKSYILEQWLDASTGKDSYEEHFVTQNTETQDLIGISTLDNKDKLSYLIDSLIEKAILYLSKIRESIERGREEKLKLIMDELEIDEKGITKKKENICLEFIFRCIKELIQLEENYDKSKGIKTITSFNLGIVSSACIFGKTLIIKGINQISPSVIERINSVLEYPRSLVLTEDTQGIFNNQQIFKDLYNSNKRSIPISDNFTLCFTSREVVNGRLSEAFKSRCTTIICPSYNNKLYLGIEINIINNYRSIAKSIIINNDELQNELIKLYNKICKKHRIPVLSFIRWCNTTKRINECIQDTNIKHIVGIAVLRSIFDGYEPNIRKKIVEGLLFDYLPEKLYNLLTKDSRDVVCESPFIIKKESRNVTNVVSIYSNIKLQVFNSNINKLEEINWTKSAADMADSILTSIAAHTMLIFEGPPGRGKTAISMATFEVLGIDYKRINLSPSTTEEDIFARIIPNVVNEDNIKTEIQEGPLYQVLRKSSNSIEYCKNGLLLDEINLASNELLDQLYSFLTSLFYKKIYYTPQGESYEIGNIGVIATMNDAKLSNARTTLSSTILNLSHTFKLPNYEPEEMMILAENILGREKLFKDKECMKRALNCFFSSQKYKSNNNETGGVTLREILKLREITNKCPDVPLDTLLDLVLCTNMSEEDAIKFKKENHFTTTLSNIIPEIKNNKLCFKDLIEFDLIRSRYDGPINKQFTLPEKNALMKILIGLKAKRTILLSGNIGTGKTYIVESLAEIIGIKLNIIQFNTETSSSDTIGRLEMSVDSNEVLDIKNEMNKLMNLLIDDEWSRITSYINFINKEKYNYEGFKKFFEEIFKENPLKQDAAEQLKICYNKMKHFSTLSCTSFEFKKSLLINAMEKGEWVLIDDVNYAPQEIERLMSLLEENSSLTIFEQNPPVMYSRHIIEDTSFMKYKQIHKNFRLFVITSNESTLSSAIKSRCLCVKLQPFMEAQHYAELMLSCLNKSNLSDNDIISTSTHIGKAFSDIIKYEKDDDYILKNYKLTSVNLVNLSNILLNSREYNGKTFSDGINFSIFSMFNKNEQSTRFIEGLSKEIDFNITANIRIMKDKKHILNMIEKNILEYTKIILKNKNNYKKINKKINTKLSFIFEKLYNKKRMAIPLKISNKNKSEIFTYIKNSRNNLLNNLESFTLADIEEYKDYIEEVLCILKELVQNKKEEIYNYLYYLEFLSLLFMELTSINNTKIKGLKLNTIENSPEFFSQFGDSSNEAEKNAKIIYWFRNVLNGFNILIPENVSTVDSNLSIIAIYYNYYYEKYNEDVTTIKGISKDSFIYLKMLENEKLRKILKYFNFHILKSNVCKVFNILVNYEKSISVEIGESANEELTIEIGENIIIKYNNEKYYLDKIEDINNLEEILGLDNYNNKITIYKNNINEDIDYIIPKCLCSNKNSIGGNLFWFYKIFANEYLSPSIINNMMLCEFNDAIEYLLKFKIFNSDNLKGIWNIELEDILEKGYHLINSLRYLKNDLWEDKSNDDKRKKVNQFIENINDIKKYSKLFSSCETGNIIIENIINLIDKIKNYFKKYEINIWEKMELFTVTCKSYLEEEILKEKFKKEKIEYAKKLEKIKNEINDICKPENKYKFNYIFESIKKLENQLNDKNTEEIINSINEIEKRVNMAKIANESSINDTHLKKSQILNHNNNNNNNFTYNNYDKFSKILKKYSMLYEIIDNMETVNDQQAFINCMFKICDITALKSFNNIYESLYKTECLNNNYVSEYLITELKHLVNSLFISDIINKYDDFSDFVKKIFLNDKACIRCIGSHFEDDNYIHLPNFDILDLKYCVRYGLKRKEKGSLIELSYIDSDIEIRNPYENEKIEDYLIYLISCFIKNIDNSKNIDDIIKNLKEKERKQDNIINTVENLKNAVKIIMIFKDIEYKYNYDWLLKNIDEMKNEYWKEPGKILVKDKFNTWLQFNDSKNIFNGKKIIAKSLYATYEASNLNIIQYKNRNLQDILSKVLKNIYEDTASTYDFGYRIISFYKNCIYKDNVAETMITIIYSIFEILSNKKITEDKQIKNIIKMIIKKFIIYCIENEIPDFKNVELINIFNILKSIIYNKYNKVYEIQKKELEDKIKNKIETFTNTLLEKEEKIENELKEKIEDYENELKDYEEEMKKLREIYKQENNIKIYIITKYNNFKKFFSGTVDEENNEEIEEKYKKEYEEYIKENTEELKLKEYFKCHKKKPFNSKFDIKLKTFKEKCKELKKINQLKISDWKHIKNIINDNKNEYLNKYNIINNNLKDCLVNDIDQYFIIIDENENLTKIQYPQYINTEYKIDEEDIKILKMWIKELLNCEINMDIKEYKENYYESVNDINKTLKKYSANTNWIFDKENEPKFLLDRININLGIYILKHVYTNNIGSITFDNNCPYPVCYKLEQVKTNAIIAYSSGDKLQQNEPMTIRFRLNKNLKENETIKCEFYIKLININNEECDRCKVVTYLNVIPLCLKFKLNEKYNIDENKNININHYINLLEIKHQYPGSYSSNSLGIIINENSDNRFNKIKFEQNQGKIISEFEAQLNNLKCSNVININLKELELFHLNLNFIIPKDIGLIVCNKNGKCIDSIDVIEKNPISFFLFNMSIDPININYAFNIESIDMKKKIQSINPGERKKIVFNVLKKFNSENIRINDKNIKINIIGLPKLDSDYKNNNNFNEIIYWANSNKNIQNKLSFLIINNKYKIQREKEIKSVKLNKIYSCYLLFNNKIIAHKFSINYTNINSDKSYCKVYGLYDNNLCDDKIYKDVDIALLIKDNNSHIFNIFSEDQKKKFLNILNNNEFKNNLLSDSIADIEKSINKLIKRELPLNETETINENINNLDITGEKTSIDNIIIYLMKMSITYENEAFINQLKSWLKIMYNREILLPYFDVNNTLNETIKQFLEKLSYIISFVDTVVNPGVLSNDIINYINKEAMKEEEIPFNDKELINNFNKYFNNESDNEDEELIYYNNNIYKHYKNDAFDNFNKQIENSKLDNSNYDKEKINQFLQTYKKEIENNKFNITNNKINFSNLVDTLDDCIRIISKCPLILSTIEENEELEFCIKHCQIIYDFISNLTNSPIYKTEFSEIINSSLNEVQNILSKFEFFNLNFDKINNNDSAYRKNNGVIVQCELPFDNSFENNLAKKKREQESKNRFVDNNSTRNVHFNNSQFTSKNNKNYKGEISNNTNYDDNKQFMKKQKDKVKHKIESIRILTDEERKTISIPFLNDNLEQGNDNNDNNDILDNINELDYENSNKEMKISMDILERKLNKTTPTEFLIMLLEKISYKNQTLSEIKSSKLKKKGLSENGTFKYVDECSQSSSFIQSTISNIIKSNIKYIDNNEILPNCLFDSYVDIAVDITHMSPIQRITALVISTGISLSLFNYGVNIRISVFGERNGVWLLSDDFKTNVEVQLARLRDALASKKRYMSFPGDALCSLKQDWLKRFNQNQTNYTSVLISSLISPQVINKQIKWSDEISNNIVVFGLKSEFDEAVVKKYNIYEELLQIPSENKNKITQKFLDPKNVIGQNESENELLEILCKSLVTSCIYKSGNKDNFKETKIIMNDINEIINERIPLKTISEFINKNREDKLYFAQNIPHIMTAISKINEEFNPPKIPLPSANELQNISVQDSNSIRNLKNIVEIFLKSQFGLVFAPNTSSGKVPSASGGTISITAIKKWIVSGFTYKEIFLKKAGKTKRKYSITIVIDFSSSIHLSCNYSHAISTILLLLLAPSILQDNEEIKIDVIISTKNGPKIMYLSSEANTFQSLSCIQLILDVIDNEISKYCTPGNTLNAAYQLQLQKGGVGMGKNIFFITDGYVTSKKEIKFANSIINSCENSGIDLITIGVGSYPNGIIQLYPKCCYAPSLRDLGDAISYLFSISRNPVSNEIIPQVIINNTSEETQIKLTEMIKQPPNNKELQRSIENKKMNYIEMMGNNNIMTLDDNIFIHDENPEIEPYYDGLFKGFNILVVILYLGGYEYQGKKRDQNITIEQFESGTGKALKRKGFRYKLVFSYGDTINELTKSINGRCPYIETWVFCSGADGTLPDKAIDKDSNKIIPFFECITEFNNKGGGLLLFCDNEPYTLEANILLTEYLRFKNENGLNVKPRFIMKGNYNQPDFNKKYIVSLNPKNINENKNGKFKPDIKIPPPGKCKDRISLRPGLRKFSEGITLSYAECADKGNNYSPFIPFAYLTDTTKERPFILYYDPKMNDGDINQGPIVVHGGFTSAFYDFSFDGTGRLVTSIACWLVRYEERFYRQVQCDLKTEIVNNLPLISIPNYNGRAFTKWVNKSNSSLLYSIMVLDVSGSMNNYYDSLISMANSIINNQMKNINNHGTIILFGDRAKAIIKDNYKLLIRNDISNANVGGGTNFYLAFSEAIKYINPSGVYDDKRLLFLTDGECNVNGLNQLCDQISNAGFSIHILGFGSEQTFNHLKPFIRRNGTFQVYSNFKDIASSAAKIFAAE
ncbi:hypothetical protein BCR36DRAFT_408210 [Piromyces finnis]|uniref:VWFA domain-containing protein n=1 Tax=Piromyces finnis TaxID=1754191 RepID=A0A1Y1VQ35_9FUNG|nr:hypothetical protein BCR36DRAFT_408210 [Piromyces finnis]|eukprot:ORX61262.1 hypothetical protein BCR36DRAFT_408210 [Piromyces finnis]